MTERSYPPVRGQGRWLKGVTPTRGQGGGQEEQPHIQGAVAAWAQEGLEVPSHVEGQEEQWLGNAPYPR